MVKKTKQNSLTAAEKTEIIAQALREIRFARNYKQGKVRHWKTNEDLYYSRKISPESSRSNVDLGEMQSYVHTIMSKVDSPLIFKFTKRKSSQLKRVARLNALRVFDQSRDDWDIKDLAGKKQAIIYGRAIYSYYASSVDGEYQPNLDPVDVYDFLIDPSGGGLDLDRARYLGDYGVSYTKEDLEAGIKSGDFDATLTQQLIDGAPNNTDVNQETTNKYNRTRDTNVWQITKELTGTDKMVFWRWGTTYKGKRYYMLITERGGVAIQIKPLSDITQSINPKYKQPRWWYWSYAAFIDLTEFWTPSYCDYVREVVMGKAKSVNEGLDNAEAVNKPQKVVNVGAVRDFASLKYRRDGIIKVKKEFDATKAISILTVPQIKTPLEIYKLLDGIQSRASGVTNGDQGADPNKGDSKLGIYEGNQANSADRFGLFNRSYSFAYKRFATLYQDGAKEHLKMSIEIEILGPDGVQLEPVSKKDIFWKDDYYNIQVQSSNAELALSGEEKKTKMDFLSKQEENPNGTPQNKQAAYEIQAEIAGFEDDDIRRLLDTSEYGDAAMFAEADEDIEKILDGQKLTANPIATNAYKARIVYYMDLNSEELTKLQHRALAAYVSTLQPVIMKNMARDIANAKFKATMAAIASGNPPQGEPEPEPSAPPAGPGIPAIGAPAGPAAPAAPVIPQAIPQGGPAQTLPANHPVA